MGAGVRGHGRCVVCPRVYRLRGLIYGCCVGMDVVWGALCRESCHTLGTRRGLALMCVGYQAVSKHGVVGKGLGGCYSFGVLWMCWCVFSACSAGIDGLYCTGCRPI